MGVTESEGERTRYLNMGRGKERGKGESRERKQINILKQIT